MISVEYHKRVYDVLTDFQIELLENGYRVGRTIQDSDEDRLREARELEAEGYVSISETGYGSRHYYVHATFKGRLLLADGIR